MITIIGSLTAIFAATIGLYQKDIKRVIAYSTCSQLGYMILILGSQKYDIALYHLFNHAYFKALLFLSAGSIIHATGDEQDLRKMGGLINITPFTYTMTLIGSLSLMALPFLTGYYSKDIILEIASNQYLITGTFSYWLGTITATITALYSTSSLIKCYGGSTLISRIKTINSTEASLTMSISCIILSILSIIIGYITKDYFTGCGSSGLGMIAGGGCYDYDFRLVPLGFQYYPLLATILGITIAILMTPLHTTNREKSVLTTKMKIPSTPYPGYVGVTITRYLQKRYYIDTLYNNIIISGTLLISGIISLLIDKGFLTLIGPYGIKHILLGRARYLAILDSGYLPHYTILFFMTILVILRLFSSY
jgi:NADH-ubiquinone oxidoreductase chain 5